MEKIAIIGSGIAGLGSAWFLHRKNEVTVYEAGASAGGHSNTVTVEEGGREVPIDTGFMVYNEVTYPNLIRLFDALEVPTKSTSMSFSVLEDGVEIVTESRGVEKFDKVILATHAPQSLKLLDQPTDLETELLSPFAFEPNEVKLHSDPRFMPTTRRCWASWNYRSDPKPNGDEDTTIHYWMNSLQGVSDQENYFVSLNAGDRVPSDRCHLQLDYEHPLFDLEAIQAQKRLPELNETKNGNRTFFCGAWFRYGFHEDGLLSAVNLCSKLLQGDPWENR